MARRHKIWAVGLGVATMIATSAYAGEDFAAFDGIGSLVEDMRKGQDERIAVAHARSVSSQPIPGQTTCSDPRIQNVETRLLEVQSLFDLALEHVELEDSIDALRSLSQREVHLRKSLRFSEMEMERLAREAARSRSSLQLTLAKLQAMELFDRTVQERAIVNAAIRENLNALAVQERKTGTQNMSVVLEDD